jgi:hypothetical protein
MSHFSELRFRRFRAIFLETRTRPLRLPRNLVMFHRWVAMTENRMNNRLLGTIAMICAPAMLIEGLLRGEQENALITGIASMVFMTGWICSNVGMRRMRATGTGEWGRAVLLIQLVGLVLALMFGFFEATGLLGRESLLFNITDVAWPLSMLWMIVVGIAVIAANRLSGWQRFVPLLCPLWLPIAIVVSMSFGDDRAGGIVGFGYAAVLWGLLGYVIVRSESRVPSPAPQSTVE